MASFTDAVCYRWQDLPQDHPLDRLDRRRIFGEKMMVAEIVLHAGCYVPTHAHENEQIAIVVSGAIRFGIGAEDSDARRRCHVEATDNREVDPPGVDLSMGRARHGALWQHRAG